MVEEMICIKYRRPNTFRGNKALNVPLNQCAVCVKIDLFIDIVPHNLVDSIV